MTQPISATQKVDTLLPCPFCNAFANTEITRTKSGYRVDCSMYCCSMEFRKTKQQAIDHWNTRYVAIADMIATYQPQEEQASSITQSLVRQLLDRDAKGLSKYGKTLDRDDLTRDEWLQHLIEELLDAAGYAESAKHVNAARATRESEDV